MARKGTRWSSDDAVGAVFSMLVGGVVFIASIGALLVSTAGVGAHPDDASHDLSSAALADLLVGSPGIGWDVPSGTVVRLGLAAEPGRIDPASLAALRGAGADADATNQVIDYEEARASLGMDTTGFRVTVAPLGLAEQLAAMDLGGIRAGYIGAWPSAPSVLVPDDEQTVPAARAAVDAKMASVAVRERTALMQLGLGFSDAVHLDSTALDVKVQGDPARHITLAAPSSALQGDVFVDQKQSLADVLPVRLAQYDLLVVGSGVQHGAMTAEPVKEAIRDWVISGGTLIVLGSGSQTTQWLQPLFHVGTANVNGGAYAPHITHPMLREPHGLAWSEYPTPAKAWAVRDNGAQAHEDDFDHVIRAGGGGDLLAVSRPGAFGQGTVLLTSYQPGVLADQIGPAEPGLFLHNLVVFTDRSHLYLEYGGVPPAGAPYGSAVRHALLHDDVLGPVPVRVQVLAWREG